MRPVGVPQEQFRYPLNTILGTEAQVRLLRVLAVETDGPVSGADAAARAGLTLPGARKALEKLVESGAVQGVGGGRRQQFELRREDSLVMAIEALFHTEIERYDSILSSLKGAVGSLESPPRAVWVSSFPAPADPRLVIGMLQDAGRITSTSKSLRQALLLVEKRFDLTIEVNAWSKADLPNDEKSLLLIYGVSPFPDGRSGSEPSGRFGSHLERDERLLETCRIIAAMIGEDRSIVLRARQHVDRLLGEAQGTAVGDLEEWREILRDYSSRRLMHLLKAPGEQAARLRQSCPFLGVLGPEERNRIAERLREKK